MSDDIAIDIRLRWLDLDFFPASRDEKIYALKKLEISVEAGQSPLDAWVIAMCRENALPERLPSANIGHAAMGCCPRWIWWLA